MNVLMLSPGYPADMPEYARGLAECGVTVIGIGDSPTGSLPEMAKRSLAHYVEVRSLWDTGQVIAALEEALGERSLDLIECLWEPGIMLAAELRAYFGVPGMSVEEAHRFRDKEAMKVALDAAGIRTPRHVAAESVQQCWEAAEKIGFPLILKPIAGAGSADTYRVNDADELRDVLPRLRHVPMVSVEEFIDGEEYTFDTITIDGKIHYYNVHIYDPRPLIARTNEWISPQAIALKDVDDPKLADGIRMGYAVNEALNFQNGFTHMEWYRKSDGEVVFGEIGARPPGAHHVDMMKFACDFDPFRAWASAMTKKTLGTDIERKYNVVAIYKRARGVGRITRYEGADELNTKYGEHVVWNTLLPPGTPRRNWKQTILSDGFVMLRHPDLQKTIDMGNAVASDLHIYAE